MVWIVLVWKKEGRPKTFPSGQRWAVSSGVDLVAHWTGRLVIDWTAVRVAACILEASISVPKRT